MPRELPKRLKSVPFCAYNVPSFQQVLKNELVFRPFIVTFEQAEVNMVWIT